MDNIQSRLLVFIILVVMQSFKQVQAQVLTQSLVNLKAEYHLDFIGLNSHADFILIHNPDGTIRGGAYNVSAFGGVFVTSLHIINGSLFFDLHKRNYYFIGFKSLKDSDGLKDVPEFNENVAKSSDDAYQWLDVVFMIDRHLYPMGVSDIHVKDIFVTLATRTVRPNTFGYALNGFIPNATEGRTYHHIRTNQGTLDVDSANKKLFLNVDRRKSSLAQGSSGTLVVARTFNKFSNTHDWDLDYSEIIPVGILKCRVKKSVLTMNNLHFEIQTFDFFMPIRLKYNVSFLMDFPDKPLCMFVRSKEFRTPKVSEMKLIDRSDG